MSLLMAGWLGPDDLSGPFQPKPFYDSVTPEGMRTLSKGHRDRNCKVLVPDYTGRRWQRGGSTQMDSQTRVLAVAPGRALLGQSYRQPHTWLRGFGSSSIRFKWQASKVRKAPVLVAQHLPRTRTDTELCRCGKKLQLIWVRWEIHGDSRLRTVSLQEQLSMGWVFWLFHFYFFFVKDSIKEHMLSMEDFWMKSINHSPVRGWLLLFLEDLNNPISAPIFQQKIEEDIFQLQRHG